MHKEYESTFALLKRENAASHFKCNSCTLLLFKHNNVCMLELADVPYYVI